MIIALSKVLGSWWLTALLLIVACAHYVAFTFGEEPYEAWTHFLLQPGGAIIWLGAIVNLLFINVRIAMRAKKRERTIDAIRSMDVWEELPAPASDAIQQATAWMRSLGFTPVADTQSVRAVQGRHSYLPGMIFRTGIMLLLLALFASVHLRQSLEAAFRISDTKTLFNNAVSLQNIAADLPSDYLLVGDESSFTLGNVSAIVRSLGKEYRITAGFPTRINGGYYRIVHLGYAQPFIVSTSGRHNEKNAFLDLLPPGKTQIIPLSANGNFMTIALAPERIINKGLLKGKQYNLALPTYGVVIQQGDNQTKPSPLATIKPGARMTKGPLTLAFGKSALFVKLQAVHDPALWWIYAGVVVSLAGVVLLFSRFFWYRKELAVVLAQGTLYIGSSDEYFKKWGIERFFVNKDKMMPIDIDASRPQRPDHG
jgi:hypothetical protein